MLSNQQVRVKSILDDNNNILIIVSKKNSNCFNIFVNKLIDFGIQMWQFEICNVLNNFFIENYGIDIQCDVQGNIYICGVNYNGSNYDYLVFKYNFCGIEFWRISYNGMGNSDDVFLFFIIDVFGNVYVIGVSQGNGMYIDFVIF